MKPSLDSKCMCRMKSIVNIIQLNDKTMFISPYFSLPLLSIIFLKLSCYKIRMFMVDFGAALYDSQELTLSCHSMPDMMLNDLLIISCLIILNILCVRC